MENLQDEMRALHREMTHDWIDFSSRKQLIETIKLSIPMDVSIGAAATWLAALDQCPTHTLLF